MIPEVSAVPLCSENPMEITSTAQFHVVFFQGVVVLVNVSVAFFKLYCANKSLGVLVKSIPLYEFWSGT